MHIDLAGGTAKADQRQRCCGQGLLFNDNCVHRANIHTQGTSRARSRRETIHLSALLCLDPEQDGLGADPDAGVAAGATIRVDPGGISHAPRGRIKRIGASLCLQPGKGAARCGCAQGGCCAQSEQSTAGRIGGLVPRGTDPWPGSGRTGADPDGQTAQATVCQQRVQIIEMPCDRQAAAVRARSAFGGADGQLSQARQPQAGKLLQPQGLKADLRGARAVAKGRADKRGLGHRSR